jgi:hypothetical protein
VLLFAGYPRFNGRHSFLLWVVRLGRLRLTAIQAFNKPKHRGFFNYTVGAGAANFGVGGEVVRYKHAHF